MTLLNPEFASDLLQNSDAGAEKSPLKQILTSRIALELYFVLFSLMVGVVVGAFIPVVGPLVGFLAGLSFAALAVGAESILFPGKPASTARACLGAFLFVGGAVGLILILGIAILPALAIDFSVDTGLTISFILLPILLLGGFYNSRPRSSMEEDIFTSTYAKCTPSLQSSDDEELSFNQNMKHTANNNTKNNGSALHDQDDDEENDWDLDKNPGTTEDPDIIGDPDIIEEHDASSLHKTSTMNH